MRALLPVLRCRRARWAGILLVLAALPACGAARPPEPERGEQLLSAASAPGRGCVVEQYPEVLPSANEVVDSAMVVAEVRELLRADPARHGHVLLSLTFSRDGINIRRDVIERDIGALAADSVQRIVFAARREVTDAERDWGVRLRVEVADPVGLRVGRRQLCPPVARDRAMEAMMSGFHPAGVRFRGGRRERIVHMRALIDRAGTVASARIARGELGGSSLERDLARYLTGFIFEPATVDGEPVEAWVEIPVRVPG